MDKIKWEEEKTTRRKIYIEKHERLHRLFIENPFFFEQEKRKMINEIIDRVKNEMLQKKLISLQSSWDRKMRKAGSKENRFILAQFLFWEWIQKV